MITLCFWQNGGFAWKIWIKWHESPVFLRELTFFLQYGHESSVFFRKLTFLSQYGHSSGWFFFTNRKRIREQFTFLSTYGYDNRGSFMKNLKKKRPESIVFLKEWTLFLTKCRHKMILENERFLTKCGHESSIFFVKNRKKRVSYRLFCPII